MTYIKTMFSNKQNLFYTAQFVLSLKIQSGSPSYSKSQHSVSMTYRNFKNSQ